jgi:cytochrome c553
LERGAIKLIRVNEIISQPTRSKPILSHVNNEIIKRILGTAEVAADGSVAFEAPACVPLQLQLLDEHGMAVLTMRSLIYAQPGEQVTCVGCHEQRNFSPPLAPMPRLRVQKLVPPAGPRYEGGFSFLRTVQPVLDRYCIGCHGLEKTEGNINLLGTMTGGRFSASYDSLLRGKAGLVKIAQRNGETHFSTPKEYYAHAGRLAKLLLAGHPDAEGRKRVELDRESFQRVVDWLDLNAQFYGDYSFNRIENQPPSAEGEKSLREAIARRFGSELAQQPFAALVNVAMPSESRILKAPLAREAGGWGLISRGGWRNTADPDYREMVKLVEASITPLSHQDIAGTCGRSQGCRCGCCWVRLANEARQKTQHTASTTASAGGE